MEIKNEIKQRDEEKKNFVHRSLADVQRARIHKLMENPEKAVVIPDFNSRRTKEYEAPSFIRNVMGSSAGAGSGEFHVYRHLRRKEYARQKHLKVLSETEKLDMEFQNKLEQNQKLAEERTDKKRQKRLKKKNKQKQRSKRPKLQEGTTTEDNSEGSDENSGAEKDTASDDEQETKNDNEAPLKPAEDSTTKENCLDVEEGNT